MLCSKETLASFFYDVSTSSLLVLLFLYFSSIWLLKLINFIGSYPLIQRSQNGYDQTIFSEEEEEEEEEENRGSYYHVECTEKDHLVADIIHGGESLVFVSNNSFNRHLDHVEEFKDSRGPATVEDEEESFASEQFSVQGLHGSESEHDDENDIEQETPTRDADSIHNTVQKRDGPTSTTAIDLHKSELKDSDEIPDDEDCAKEEEEDEDGKNKVDSTFSGDETFFSSATSKFESKKSHAQEKDEDEEIFGDSCTVGSTSKSSSEWRSSINCRDSCTEDPFSSSSRRSCPKWESYTVFQKYDEEMMFLDRISAQKLHETESLRSIQVCPRSISDRIIHKFATINKTPSNNRHNPSHELEAAYVAQICLTWEALNWNYNNFERKRRNFDPGCPAHIAQHFQQFQVLLQRYIENEPYEQGRRPEVYARMRLLAPKLLLVPEYRDSEEEQKDEGFGSRISSASFLKIMEDGIRTFMDFLKADKKKPCQILTAFFRRNRRGSVDPTLLRLMKKVNKKKKTKLKDIRRARKCIRKRKLKVEEEFEILMGLIDLKVVSRVLRMADISEEQLHWCEEKMSKVRVLDGKLQRDSSTLFFPAH